MFTVTRRKLWFTAVFAVAFGAVDLLAQIATGERADLTAVSWLRTVLAPLLAGVVAWALFSVLDRLGAADQPKFDRPDTVEAETALADPPPLPSTETHATPHALRFALAAGLVPLAAWLVQFAHFWPLASMNDLHWVLHDPIGSAVQHPLAHNLWIAALTRLGGAITGSLLGGVVFAALVQMLLWASVLAWTVFTLARFGTRRWALLALIAFATLVPIVGNTALALVKDSMFSLFVLALVPVLLTVRATRGRILARPLFFVAALVALVGFAVMRNNGLIVVALVLVALWLFAGSAKRLATLLVVVTITISALPSIATTLRAGPGKSVEAVGVPLQAIGHLNRTNPECMPAAQRDYFDNIMPASAWADAWVPGSVDPTKDAPDFDRSVMQGELGTFVSQWLRVAVACPGEVTGGVLLHSAKLWRFDAGTVGVGGQSVFTAPVSNHPGNRETLIADYASQGVESGSLLPAAVQSVYDPLIRQSLSATPHAGTWLWLMLLSIAGFAYRRRGEWVAVYLPSLLTWLTLLAAAPTSEPFRYVAFAVFVVPVGTALLFGAPAQTRSDDPRSR